MALKVNLVWTVPLTRERSDVIELLYIALCVNKHSVEFDRYDFYSSNKYRETKNT